MSKEHIEYKNSQAQLTIADHKAKFKQPNLWQSRSNLEKALIIFSLLCIGTIIALAVAYELLIRAYRGISEKTECTKTGCIKAANNLLYSMDLEAQPCDDFFQYACGNWNKRNIIPEDRGSYSTFVQLRDELQVVLKNIFEDEKKELLSNPEKMVKDTYQACMNEDDINKLEGKPLLDILATIMGGWPLLTNNWDENNFDWITVTAQLKVFGASYLISFYVYADNKNTSNNIINLDHTSLGLVRDFLLKDEYEKQRNAYKTYMEDVATLLNKGPLMEEQLKDINDILIFERKLVKITTPPEERRNQSRMYNKMSLGELKTTYRNINFTHYFSLVLPNETLLMDDEAIIVNELKYYEDLGPLIADTGNRILANYLAWRFSQRYIWDLSKEFRSVKQKYETVLSGTSAQEARWRSCVDFVNSNLGLAVGMLYVKHAFHAGAKDAADSMIKDLRMSFAQILQDLDWMDDQTKRYGKEKLDRIIERIGYPKGYEDSVEIEKEYEGLHITGDQHFRNNINFNKFWAYYEIKDLRNGFNKTRWSTDPAIVNAYYNFMQNSITFPAGILQPPFFDADRPRSMNYGAIGMVIGHEITHGFDDQGRQFDSNGNLYQWWSNAAEAKFIEKSKCIIEQYKSYQMPGTNMTLNGINTQGENIADNGGLKEAYMAYKTAEIKYGVEPTLPGLSFTHDQLFFLSFANVWCGTFREQSLRIQILSGAHSPGRFRVIGTLSNSKEFLAAFNCTKGSKMYREEPCHVW